MHILVPRQPSMACAVALLSLTACSVNSDVEQAGSFVFKSIIGSNSKVSRERAAAVPYATIGLQLGSSDQALLTLGSARGDELQWFAGETLFVATNHGRVMRTLGLPYDLGGIHRLNAFPARENNPEMLLTSSSMDFPELGVFGATVQCSRINTGEDNVAILGASIATRHVVENCEVPVLKWKFKNDFWEDRTTGYVWRSRQYIHPKSPPITLEVFRPEQNDANSN
jgi:hypothetical protein